MLSEHVTDNVTVGQEGLTNKVIKTLCFKGGVYKTFGENIILLLNRESTFPTLFPTLSFQLSFQLSLSRFLHCSFLTCM